ncbi:hypothetical protein Ancab_016176 [Ancistrocladus abbreviatus]
MPSKLKKAIAAVKDHTSISIAKVKTGNDSSNLEVAVLKATTHDESPIDERYVSEVLQYVSSNKSYAAICARAIGRRIGRTRNWVVAVKSLMLVLRIFQDGDPHFPKEVLHAMKRGYKILNLSSFRDDSSTSCPWDFTAFVRTFALYLDERLDCFVTGKLQRRMEYRERSIALESSRRWQGKRTNEPVRDMKPAMLLDRILYWQRLLDRAIATRPTGAAKTNSFFHLQYNSCVSAFQTCVKASKQFEELCSFYDLCKGIGVGRTSEYPSVQKVSDELVETLQEFLKDQSSFPPANGRTPSAHKLLPQASSLNGGVSSSQRGELNEQSDHIDGNSDYGSLCTSLEDLISADAGATPAKSFDGERYSDAVDKQSQLEDFFSTNDDSSVRSEPNDHKNGSGLDLLSLDDGQLERDYKHEVKEEAPEKSLNLETRDGASGGGWELVLFESSTQPSRPHKIGNDNDFQSDFLKGFNAEPSLPQNHYNPFLQDAVESTPNTSHTNNIASANDDLFAAFVQNNSESTFASSFTAHFDNGSTNVQPTFCAELSNDNSGNGGISSAAVLADFFADFGNTSANANGTTPPPAEFGNAEGLARSTSLPVDFGNGPASLSSNFGNNSSRTNHSIDFGAELGNSNGNLNSPIGFLTDFGTGNHDFLSNSGNRRGSLNVLASFSVSSSNANGNSDTANVVPTFDAAFDDGSNTNTMNAIVPFGFGVEDPFSSAPTFQIEPTFHATNPVADGSLQNENNPLGSSSSSSDQVFNVPMDQESLLQQQQLWLQNQNKIIAKYLT